MLGNLARPVSRGERGSDAPALPDCVVAAPSARLAQPPEGADSAGGNSPGGWGDK